MNQLAVDLNNDIKSESPEIFTMLSRLGGELFMPKGIITQGAEASLKAHKYNATIGIATANRKPMYIDSIYKNLTAFNPSDIFPYAPTAGKPALRKLWLNKMLNENPSLKDKHIGLPITVGALTHGLSVAADMFCDDGDYIVLPDKFWGNYRLTFNAIRGGIISTYPLFNQENKFNVKGLLDKVQECGRLKPKVIVVLNFPNNPTGFTPTVSEADSIVSGLKSIADSGIQVVVLVDDAYFGTFYTDSLHESIFGKLIGVSKNLLPVKLDGATKEIFVWGFRVGFITFGSNTMSELPKTFYALEQKVCGCIRGNINSGASISQEALIKGLEDQDCYVQQKKLFDVLKSRAYKCMEVLSNQKYSDKFTAYPFNSGYFLTVKLNGIDAEALRVHLLDKYGVGTISTNSTDLRIAFSAIDENDIPDLFELIYAGCKDLSK